MRNVLFLFFIFSCLISLPCKSIALTRNNNDDYKYFAEHELLKDLSFAERQVFNKIYSKDNTDNRLERLEMLVYGAIQDGEKEIRIKKIKKAVTNISQGGNGLQYTILGMGSNNSTWGVNNNYGHNPYHTHRLPPPSHPHSHRVPSPPLHPHQQNNPIINGDYSGNYSLGTSIKILDD